jgi:hypothetical protein
MEEPNAVLFLHQQVSFGSHTDAQPSYSEDKPPSGNYCNYLGTQQHRTTCTANLENNAG